MQAFLLVQLHFTTFEGIPSSSGQIWSPLVALITLCQICPPLVYKSTLGHIWLPLTTDLYNYTKSHIIQGFNTTLLFIISVKCGSLFLSTSTFNADFCWSWMRYLIWLCQPSKVRSQQLRTESSKCKKLFCLISRPNVMDFSPLYIIFKPSMSAKSAFKRISFWDEAFDQGSLAKA